MMYSTVVIGGKELKLRLDARTCVDLERRMGKSPLSIFSQEGELPKLEDLIVILHGGLQKYNAGYDLDKAYDLYDEFVEEGKTFAEDFIPLVMDILKVSGFFKDVPEPVAEPEDEEDALIVDAEIIDEKK